VIEIQTGRKATQGLELANNHSYSYKCKPATMYVVRAGSQLKMLAQIPKEILCLLKLWPTLEPFLFIGLALVGKDIVFRFIIEYNSLRDFGP
jgi:hypothetical protein